MKNVDWDDYRLFLQVARSGGLSAAVQATGSSPATLSRRLRGLEEALRRTLFVRAQTGYALTAEGQALLDRLSGMEAVARGVENWAAEAAPRATVRITAGSWISMLLCQNIEAVNPDPATVTLSIEIGEARAQILHRETDIAMRAVEPTEPQLAIRRISGFAYAPYVRRNAGEAIRGRLVAVRPDMALSPYLKFPHEQDARPVVAMVSRATALADLARAGAGTAILPAFIGDMDPDLERAGGLIEALQHQQWIVVRNDDRHLRPIRQVLDRMTKLLLAHRDLFEGRRAIRG